MSLFGRSRSRRFEEAVNASVPGPGAYDVHSLHSVGKEAPKLPFPKQRRFISPPSDHAAVRVGQCSLMTPKAIQRRRRMHYLPSTDRSRFIYSDSEGNSSRRGRPSTMTRHSAVKKFDFFDGGESLDNAQDAFVIVSREVAESLKAYVCEAEGVFGALDERDIRGGLAEAVHASADQLHEISREIEAIRGGIAERQPPPVIQAMQERIHKGDELLQQCYRRHEEVRRQGRDAQTALKSEIRDLKQVTTRMQQLLAQAEQKVTELEVDRVRTTTLLHQSLDLGNDLQHKVDEICLADALLQQGLEEANASLQKLRQEKQCLIESNAASEKAFAECRDEMASQHQLQIDELTTQLTQAQTEGEEWRQVQLQTQEQLDDLRTEYVAVKAVSDAQLEELSQSRCSEAELQHQLETLRSSVLNATTELGHRDSSLASLEAANACLQQMHKQQRLASGEKLAVSDAEVERLQHENEEIRRELKQASLQHEQHAASMRQESFHLQSRLLALEEGHASKLELYVLHMEQEELLQGQLRQSIHALKVRMQSELQTRDQMVLEAADAAAHDHDRISKLEASLNTANEDLAELGAKLRDSDAKTQLTAEELEAAEEAWSMEREELSDQLEAAKQELAVQQRVVEATQQQVVSLTAARDSLSGQLSQVQVVAAGREQQLASAQQHLAAIEQQCAELGESLAGESCETSRLKEQLEFARERILQQDANLAESTQLVAECRKQIDEMAILIGQEQSAVEELNSANSHLTMKLDAASVAQLSTLTQLEEVLEQKRRLCELVQEYETLENRSLDMMSSLSEMTRRGHQLEDLASRARRSLDEVRLRLREHELGAQAAEEAMACLRCEKQSLEMTEKQLKSRLATQLQLSFVLVSSLEAALKQQASLLCENRQLEASAKAAVAMSLRLSDVVAVKTVEQAYSNSGDDVRLTVLRSAATHRLLDQSICSEARLVEGSQLVLSELREPCAASIDFHSVAAAVRTLRRGREQDRDECARLKNEMLQHKGLIARQEEVVAQLQVQLEKEHKIREENMEIISQSAAMKQHYERLGAQWKITEKEAAEVKRLLVELEDQNARIVGQRNPEQRIHFHERVKQENQSLRELNRMLERKLLRAHQILRENGILPKMAMVGKENCRDNNMAISSSKNVSGVSQCRSRSLPRSRLSFRRV